MKFKVLTTTMMWLFFAASVMAQSMGASISGKVLDPGNTPAPFANVLLKSKADSSLVKAEYTNEDGNFQLQNLQPGSYFLHVSYVGLSDYSSENFDLNAGQSLQLPAINMAALATELKEVVVKAQKPMIEVKPDRTVFNIEGSINASGSNAMELLRKAPGVVVDNNDNVMLLGRSGVAVYIDNKPSPLSSADLANFLKTVQASEIEAIEIITNPSSKYDAAGNAGIINIRMKRDKRLGANGTVELGFAEGVFPKYNGSASGNYRNKAVNLFGKYGYNAGTRWSFMDFYREQAGASFDQRATNGGDFSNHNARIGADFFIGKHHTVGVLVTGNKSEDEWNSRSRAEIATLSNGETQAILAARSDNTIKRNNYNANLNYRFDNAQGLVWNLDADLGGFRNDGNSYQPNTYLNPTETEVLEERIFTTQTPTDIEIATFKVDHERPLWKGQFGAGLKFSVVNTDNTFNFFDVIDGESVPNMDRTNQFTYQENINAAYVNYQRQAGKWNFQAGLRVEQTNSDGKLTSERPTGNDRVKRNYTDLFPSGGVTYQFDQKNAFRLTYSRRIDRPQYQDLNPFEYKLDELTYQRGNPFLKPQYSNNLQLGHTFNYTLNTTLGYSYTTDYITSITDTIEVVRSYITEANLSSQRTFSLSVSYPFAITKWWNTYTNLTMYNTRNLADFGEGKRIDAQANAVSVFSQQTFQLPKGLSLEISGFYNSPSIWGGNFRTREFWGVDAGVQKKVLEGRGNVKVSLSDIFLTMRWSGDSQFGGLYMVTRGGWESRQLRVNFTYNFGNQEVKSARRRNTGLEDEQKRIKTDNQ